MMRMSIFIFLKSMKAPYLDAALYINIKQSILLTYKVDIVVSLVLGSDHYGAVIAVLWLTSESS